MGPRLFRRYRDDRLRKIPLHTNSNPSYPSSSPALNHDLTVCVTAIVLTSKRDLLGETIVPSEENVLSHSAAIAGIDRTSIAIFAAGLGIYLHFVYLPDL